MRNEYLKNLFKNNLKIYSLIIIFLEILKLLYLYFFLIFSYSLEKIFSDGKIINL